MTIPAELVPTVTDRGQAARQPDGSDEVANPGGRGRKAPIEPEVPPDKKHNADKDLNESAKPGGKPRTATINPDVDDFRAARANLDLDNIAHDRYADVYVTIHYPDGTTATADPDQRWRWRGSWRVVGRPDRARRRPDRGGDLEQRWRVRPVHGAGRRP